MKEFRSVLWTEIALSLFPFLCPTMVYSIDMPEALIALETSSNKTAPETYTINFNNVAMIEFIRFASKITTLNFIFDEADLQFNVTVVSEEAVSAQNIMSALTQVLRMHDLTIVEQDGNVLITKSTKINAIPPIISSDLPESHPSNAALVTRVFRIKNANISSIANIIRPMVSTAALIETSLETRQLIVTDIMVNIEQIAALLASLDAPHTPLEIDVYLVKNISPQELISLAEKILTPFSEGNPLIFVPQPKNNAIYIVSTPHLIERAMIVMEDLDITPQAIPLTLEAQANGTFFIYSPIIRSGEELQQALHDMGNELADSQLADPAFLQALASTKWVPSTHSLMFVGTPQALERVKSVVAALDNPLASSQAHVFVYKPQYLPYDQIESSLNNLVPSLEATGSSADKNLIRAIRGLQWNTETHTLMVSSDPVTIKRLQELLATIDTPHAFGTTGMSFFLYKLQVAHCDFVIDQLSSLADKLPVTDAQHQDLINAIRKIECIKENNALLLTGSADTIDRLKTLIAEFDVPRGQAPTAFQAFIIYKPKFLPGPEIQMTLTDIAHDLESSGLNDPALFQSLATVRYVESTDSLIFTGNQDTLSRIQNLIDTIDTREALGKIQHIGNVTFLLHKLASSYPDKVLNGLKSFADNLNRSDPANKQLAETIAQVKWIKETNSLLFTGTPEVLSKVEDLLKKFDIGETKPTPRPERAAPTFIIYTPRYVSGEELIGTMCEFLQNLVNSGVSDTGLVDTIENLKWIEKTRSLLISGDPQSVAKVQELLQKFFDIPSKEASVPSIEAIENTSFLVYKLQYHPGNDIQIALRQIATTLHKSTTIPSPLAEAIGSMQWIQVTNSLLCSGPQDVLVQLKELIQNIDVPLRQVFIEVLFIQTTLNNSQNFGLMWGAQAQYFNKATMAGGNFPTNANPLVSTFEPTLQGINATTTPAGGITNRQVPFQIGGFDLGVIGDIIMHKGRSFLSLGSLVNAVQQDTDAVVLLNPKLITQDNRQSTIFVGQNVPYTGAIVTNTQSNTTSTANIEYRDVGMSLTITPILGDGDVITLDIVQDISQIINGPIVTSTTQLSGIQTSHAHMETRVQVPDNHFVALSGMINDSKQITRTAIPCLGGLPVIGVLFSENDRTATKSNMIIFLRPKIVNTYEEYRKITEHQEWLYKDSARRPILKEWFDEGIDMVKVPENE